MAKKKEDIPEVCKGCLKFEKFKKNCFVYWEGKNFCTMKVRDMEDWGRKEGLMNI